ncbi:MAG: NAD(P)-dependent oxidoreductase [Syntrophothermus sp.]
MKTIALFGASGRTGKLFFQLAFNAGYNIKILVRTPEKINLNGDSLQVFHGDVLNFIDCDKVIDGSDIVVNLIGHDKGSNEWLHTYATKNILSCMKKHNVKKLITLSCSILTHGLDDPSIKDRIALYFIKNAHSRSYNDTLRQAEQLKNSDIKWILVRAPKLLDGPKSDNYKVGWVGVDTTNQVTRANLADFIFKQLEDDAYVLQMPLVSD